ncbi:segregation/condensation protein A [Tissierella sp. MSJ-40]|uniref:Segregation and condensation protein A n=1 Tax=Tissierella simiarum TaxID=2841534 RepID=A0ABS6E488_9FIRM|nr:segregation/condensation protein A [Tissierella simiarum]MBU5437577.1 segregation/condensation protein A [Tissierella simiarum]
MEYKIMLESFEGPLDLLLHLIEKAQIDIYDIPINDITEQYINYIYQMEELNLELASDFLVMAATLLEIKSKMLLPQQKTDQNDNIQLELEEVDPRMELVRRLVEYKKYKNISKELRFYEEIQSKIYYKPKEDLTLYEDKEIDLEGLDLNLLIKSLNNILKKRNKTSKSIDINEMQREEYTLEECINDIKIQLENQETIKFSSLLDEECNRKEIVTYFLSVLELIRMKYIYVNQEENFSDLIINKRIKEVH